MPPLPDVRQADNFSCGEQLARSLLQFWGARPRVIALSNPMDGVHPATLLSIFRAAGLRCLSGEASVELLRGLTALGFPAAALIQKDGDGHWVGVEAVRRGRVEYQCPLEGKCRVPVAEFDAAWHDVDLWGASYRRFVVVPFAADG